MAAKIRIVRVWETAAIILAFTVAAATGEGRVTLFTFTSGPAAQQTSALVDVGSSISLRCRVEYNTTRTPTVSLKKTFSNASTVLVSTNEIYVDEHFIPTRFSINPLDTNPNGADIYEWTFKNLIVGDSGIYVCSTGTVNVSNASVSLNVTVEPSKIDFYINDELQPPSFPTSPVKKSLTLGQVYRLRCVASGANPFPNVTLLSGSTVFTPLSVQTTTARQDVPIPEAINRSTSVTVSWTMDKSYIGKPIVCTAGVKNVNATTYSFVPIVDNALPQFQCADVFNYDQKQNTFAIPCQVFGTNLTSFYVTWHNATKNMTIKGTEGTDIQSPLDKRYSLSVQRPTGAAIWYTMTLTVNDAKTVTDLTKNDYHFVVTNDRGQAVHTVDVQASGFSTPPISVAGRQIVSTLGFLAVLFYAVAATTFGRL